MSVIFTVEELRTTYLPKWQRILRLQDWNIQIEIKREREMDIANAGGCNNWHIQSRHSTIHILDTADWPTDPEHPVQDMELTLVHELLHLHLAEWRENTKPFGEQAIHAIAQALIMLDRRDLGLANTPPPK